MSDDSRDTGLERSNTNPSAIDNVLFDRATNHVISNPHSVPVPVRSYIRDVRDIYSTIDC
ncbi:uncharacterized protein EAE97_011646 [Botrytis byssoidea]|uniref:Uncharacterized protein n=1 Tax=Botrytis byssoidea TaxID=139641 RepID=A0A9P5HQG0_9HELO|nr:uncharacterized protein EAE97_011646 [Botrytis byssoidea]KAF7919728.1 hypothetical protein EAE97_011646 [Botrytis byssoidea]